MDEPYFMTNDKWYYFDFEKRRYMLTEDAPQRAKDSYTEYYKELYGGKDGRL